MRNPADAICEADLYALDDGDLEPDDDEFGDEDDEDLDDDDEPEDDDDAWSGGFASNH